ncbi:MAG: 3-phosphoshikimate 1-carboxyvinyltransferase, partial [Thermoplasmata archaeon]|nr:3-phosphoshikimate 1-carboxyvinyltransferase [Thermoplasmata archaeon]
TGRRVSEPYVRATLAILRDQGIQVRRRRTEFVVAGRQRPLARVYRVPGDVSSAAFLLAAAALTGGKLRVIDLATDRTQPDAAILPLLRSFGASVRVKEKVVTVEGVARRPFVAKMTDCPDLYPVAGVLAAFAPGVSRLTGGGHAAYKESDRLRSTGALASAFGARVRRRPDGLTVQSGVVPARVRLQRLTDHRLVMAAAVGALALREPSSIGDAMAVRKSYPGFWRDLRTLGGRNR